MTLKSASVVISTYNNGKTLGNTIDSVLNQTLAPKEIFVIDDCGQDDVVEAIGDRLEHVTLIRHEHNKGVCAARNTGFNLATGDVLLHLDGDDQIFPDFLMSIIAILNKHPDASACFTEFKIVYGYTIPEMEPIPFDLSKPIEKCGPQEHLKDYIRVSGKCIPSFCVLRREAVIDMCEGGDLYNPVVKTTGDFEFFLRLFSVKTTVFYPGIGGHYLRRPGSLSEDKAVLWEDNMFAVETVLKSRVALQLSDKNLQALKAARGSYLRRKAKALKSAGKTSEAIRVLSEELKSHPDIKTLGQLVVTLMGFGGDKIKYEKEFWNSN